MATVIDSSAKNKWFYLSAYAIAVKHGYKGTEEQFVNDLMNGAASAKAAAEAARDEAERQAGISEDNAEAASALALKAEAFGAGTRNGDPVDAEDPAYNNNAMYYANQADNSAQNAAASEAAAKDYSDHIADPVAGIVAEWLGEHVDPESGYVLDDTLSVAGAAADAAAAGGPKSAITYITDGISLLKYAAEHATTGDRGITVTTLDDGSVDIDGTSTAVDMWWISRSVSLPAGTYTLNNNGKMLAAAGLKVQIRKVTDDDADAGAVDTAEWDGVTFTLAETTRCRARLYVNSGYTFSNYRFYASLYAGAEKYDYTGVDITAREKIGLTPDGTRDYGEASYFTNKAYDDGTGFFKASTIRLTTEYIRVLKGDVVTIQKYAAGYQFMVYWFDDHKTLLGAGSWDGGFPKAAVRDGYIIITERKSDNSAIAIADFSAEIYIHRGAGTVNKQLSQTDFVNGNYGDNRIVSGNSGSIVTGFLPVVKGAHLAIKSVPDNQTVKFEVYNSAGTRVYSTTPNQAFEYDFTADGFIAIQFSAVSGSLSPANFQSFVKLSIEPDYDDLQGLYQRQQYAMRAVVSDGKYIGCNAPSMCVDNNTGRTYVAFMGQKKHYGEPQAGNVEDNDLYIACSNFYVKRPERFEDNVIAQDGAGTYKPYDPNMFRTATGTRCMFSAMTQEGTANTYREVYVDIADNGEIGQPVEMSFVDIPGANFSPGRLVNQSNIRKFINYKRGGSGTSDCTIAAISMTTAIVTHGDYKYTTIGSNNMPQLVVRSGDDFATVELMGMLPIMTAYECALGFIGDRMWLLARPSSTSDNNFYYSDDYGATFTSAGKVDVSNSKPVMLEKSDGLYILRNVIDKGVTSALVATRNVLEIDSFNGTDITPVRRIEDKFGILYPQAVDFNGNLLAVFCNGGLFNDSNITGQATGKDFVAYMDFGRSF